MKTPGIGRNDPCPCGSGKKFKHCCLGKESSKASGHGAAGISETLRSELEGRQFNSLEKVSDDILCHEYRVKALPLLGEAVQFSITR